jgi:hypothetical protein
MAEQRIPLSSRSVTRIAEMDQQINFLQAAKQGILLAAADAADVDVPQGTGMKIEGNELIITTPDAE